MYLQRKSDDEKMICWGKANQIHNWFNNLYKTRCGHAIDNCESFTITKEDLIELNNVCKKVLDSCEMVTKQKKNKYSGVAYEIDVIKNPTVAMKLLPLEISNTDYDEYYVYIVKYTMSKVNELLREFDFENDSLEYIAWW